MEAHNAQQREKVEAKRERIREARFDTGGGGGKGDRRGKRVIRRVDNGQSYLSLWLSVESWSWKKHEGSFESVHDGEDVIVLVLGNEMNGRSRLEL